MANKYWKTVVTTTVLSEGEGPPQYLNLQEVAEDIDDGESIGTVKYVHQEITRMQVADLLDSAGSSPDFLLDEEELEELSGERSTAQMTIEEIINE